MRKPYSKPTLKSAGDLADITRGSGYGWFDSIRPLDIAQPGGGGS